MFDNLLDNFNGNLPASENELRAFEDAAGLKLPEAYRLFLRIFNGGEGFIGDSYIILFPVNELVEINKRHEMEEYAPGLLLFGSDGGGEAFAFDTRSAGFGIVQFPFIGIDDKAVLKIAATFDVFLQVLCDESDI